MPTIDNHALAQAYTAVSSTQSSLGLELIANLGISNGARVLDVGCGPGNLTAHIAKLVGANGRVIGIDPSEERIAIAKETYAQEANMEFHAGCAEDLSRVASGSVDYVYVNSTLHWVQDQPRAIREFARCLDNRGRLGISGSHGNFEADHERIKREVLSQAQFAPFVESDGPKFLKPAHLRSLLDDAGLSVEQMSVKALDKWAPSGEAMVEWLDSSSSGHTYGGIPEEMRPQAREYMLRQWSSITGPDGIHMAMEILVTIAVKP